MTDVSLWSPTGNLPLDLLINQSVSHLATDKRRPASTPGKIARALRRKAPAIPLTQITETEMSNIKLTDNQRAVLNAAARSANLVAWPLPKRPKLSPGSAAIVVRGLLQKGLLEKRPAMGADPVWKEEGGKSVTLVITKAGFAACSIESADEPALKASVAAKQAVVAGISDDEPRMPRPGTKLAALVELLERDGGATIEEMAGETSWQTHSVRGVLSGVLAKKFGLVVASEKTEERGRVYRALYAG